MPLLLGSHEKNRVAVGNRFHHKIIGGFKKSDGFLQIDDVNSVSSAKDVGFHLGVPTPCLMSEMDPCFQKLFHVDV